MADLMIRGRNDRAPKQGAHGTCGPQEDHQKHHHGHRNNDNDDHHGGPGATGATGATGSNGGATGGTTGGTDTAPGHTFQAAFRSPTDPHFPGMPIFITPISIPGGITTVQQTDVRPVSPEFSSFAHVHGLIVALNADQTVQVQSSDTVTLTIAQWDIATGRSGGLEEGSLYYPAIFPALGLTDVAPTEPGSWRVPVGVALNPTTLLLIPAVPMQVLGDAIYFAQNIGTPLPVGTPVFAADGDLKIAPAVNSDIPSATAVGLIVSLNSGTPIVQTSGRVTLTPAEWAAVTDTGGLIAGNRYYVGDRTGHLTATRPTAPKSIALVGTAISTTKLLLSTPSVPS